MEAKEPTSTVPALGRLKLKRVAVRKTPEPAPVVRRTAIVAAHSDAVRRAVVGLLPKDRFEVSSFTDSDGAYDAFSQGSADLCVIGRDLPGTPGTVLCELIRKSRRGGGVAIVLMSARYDETPLLGSRDCNAFGADAFLPLPASAEDLSARVEQALSMREPVERLDVLPKDVARRVDELYERYEQLTYYELLDVPADATRDSIQQAFHNRSLLLHPDRHARLRDRHPHAWERINTVYKRISEAYKVIGDEARRRSYNLRLRSRGTLRLDETGEGRERREVGACETEEARRGVLESLELRSLGDLEGAAEAMQRALNIEPANEELQICLTSMNKLLAIIRRK